MLTRICAVAKDEGAYIADWVFHHLYFGFDFIHVYLNRTSDSTRFILDSISKVYPNVTYEYLDWVDSCPPEISRRLQVIAYGKDFEVAINEKIDWWLCIDVDEFWVPQDFSSSISQFLDRLSYKNQPICFMWHNVLGENEPFTLASPKSEFFVSPQLKTITPLKRTIVDFVRIHKHKFANGVQPIDSDGEIMAFDFSEDQKSDKSSVGGKSAYILHQMFRSEQEYLAMLIRGRPGSKQNIKLNRPGFKKKGRLPGVTFLSWPSSAYETYLERREKFIRDTKVLPDIQNERKRVIGKCHQAIEILRSAANDGSEEKIPMVLKGTRLYEELFGEQ